MRKWINENKEDVKTTVIVVGYSIMLRLRCRFYILLLKLKNIIGSKGLGA